MWRRPQCLPYLPKLNLGSYQALLRSLSQRAGKLVVIGDLSQYSFSFLTSSQLDTHQWGWRLEILTSVLFVDIILLCFLIAHE